MLLIPYILFACFNITSLSFYNFASFTHLSVYLSFFTSSSFFPLPLGNSIPLPLFLSFLYSSSPCFPFILSLHAPLSLLSYTHLPSTPHISHFFLSLRFLFSHSVFTSFLFSSSRPTISFTYGLDLFFPFFLFPLPFFHSSAASTPSYLSLLPFSFSLKP